MVVVTVVVYRFLLPREGRDLFLLLPPPPLFLRLFDDDGRLLLFTVFFTLFTLCFFLFPRYFSLDIFCGSSYAPGEGVDRGLAGGGSTFSALMGACMFPCWSVAKLLVMPVGPFICIIYSEIL